MHFSAGNVLRGAACVLSALLLAACGVGGTDSKSLTVSSSSSSSSSSPTVPSAPAVVSNALVADCSGADCGASGNSFTGSGVGVWQYTNTTNAAVAVPIAIGGTSGKNGMLVFTNQSATAQPLAGIGLETPGSTTGSTPTPTTGGDALPGPALASPGQGTFNNVPDWVTGFRPDLSAPVSKQAGFHSKFMAPQVSPTSLVVGRSQNTWMDAQAENDPATQQCSVATAMTPYLHPSTLRQQVLANDGRYINVWVEDQNPGRAAVQDMVPEFYSTKVTQAMVNNLANAFASGTGTFGGHSIYDMDTSIAGAPWGPQSYTNLLSSTLGGKLQPINIVIANLVPDGKPWGLIGYFFGLNNYLQNAEGCSNQGLVFFMDSETLYLSQNTQPTGVQAELSTLAHEFTHMIDFYQRDVLLGTNYMNDSWLEEMDAMGMETVVDNNLMSSYDTIRDERYPSYTMVATTAR